MQIHLKWLNRNTNEDGTRIYKSASVIDKLALPAVYATLPAGAQEYFDTDVIRGNTYHYRIEAFKGAETVLSQDVMATALPYSGPGPQTLIKGDWNCGYFGVVNSADFIRYAELINLLVVTTTPTTNTNDWLKVAHNGKILFIPKQPIASTMSWNTLYDNGLVYGVDGPGPRDINTRTAVNQLRTVTIKSNLFKVRLMTATIPSVPPAQLTMTGSILANVNVSSYYSYKSYDVIQDITGCEWNDIMYKFFSATPESQRGTNFYPFDAALGDTNAISAISAVTQDLVTPTTVLRRGLTTGNTPLYYPGYFIAYSTSGNNYWRPVLEWIP